MGKLISKVEYLNKIYSKEIAKINEYINGLNKDYLVEYDDEIFIPFNDIFDIPEKHYGLECIHIGELLREQGWNVEITNEEYHC